MNGNCDHSANDDEHSVFNPKLMWAPSAQQETNMDRLRKRINEKYGVNLSKFICY